MRHTFLILSFMLVATQAHAESSASPERLHEVEERGRHVMPFNLEKTQHVFEKTDRGGIQQVVAKEADDAEQIALIRQHFTAISKGFQQGDFSRQRRIHGNDMPGLAELTADYRHVHFDFRELPNGAEIEYSAENPVLVDAIHRYFNAQLTDHGQHAVSEQAAHCKYKTQSMQHQGSSSSSKE